MNVDPTPPPAEDSAESLSRRADQLLASGEYEPAAALYERVLALEPDRVKECVNLGLALEYSRRRPEALAAYDRAVALDPHHAVAWLNRGNALYVLERFDDALASYDRALELDSHLARAWFNKGDELGRRGRVIEAKACFENARDLAHAQGIQDVAVQAAGFVRQCEQILMNEYYG